MKRLVVPGLWLLALVHSWVLLSSVDPEVFYNGDGGLKSLLVRQMAAGNPAPTLQLEHEPWEEALWERGLYPFGEPFVHWTEDGVGAGPLVAFPQPFLVLSAPAYRAFGAPGLLVVPVLALWLLWVAFPIVCRRCGLSATATALATASLLFASPLAIHGALFEEHTLACALVLLGVGHVFSRRSSGSAFLALVIGLLCGGAAWLRSETALLAAALALVSAVFARGEPGDGPARAPRERWAFAAGVLLAGGLLVATNLARFGNVFGVESGLFEWEAAGERYGKLLGTLLLRCVQFLPWIVILPLGLPVLWRARRRLPGSLAWLAVGVGFLALVPLFVPNSGGKQWGPRYLLGVVPVLALGLGYLVDASRQPGWFGGRASGWFLLVAWVVAFGVGTFKNVVQGSAHLAADYAARTRPALDAVLARDEEVVVVNVQTIAQELASAFDEKRFFLARSPEDLRAITEAIAGQGDAGLLFLTRPRAAFRPRPGVVRFPPPVELARGVEFTRLGEVGDYELWSGRVLLSRRGHPR